MAACEFPVFPYTGKEKQNHIGLGNWAAVYVHIYFKQIASYLAGDSPLLLFSSDNSKRLQRPEET